MKILGIIPARFASTRLPGKPLLDIGGKSMIKRVYEQACKSKFLTDVIVATDDYRIADHVKLFGGKAELTSVSHQSGTDRCAEVSNNYPEYDIIINIQGDEPFIDPGQIDLLCNSFNDASVSLATLIKLINNPEELFDPNIPKVIVNKLGQAIYFSRAALPYYRGSEPSNWLNIHPYFKHIGIYGYRNFALKLITELPVSSLEKAESLEQLRWLENGLTIYVSETNFESLSIDTPLDLEKAIKQIESNTGI
ncbi:3-deoxy-manno-octulosonate cytidylyltransferase [Daejeonella oryzae]|uniref:3-deoxy-manno-octulosonate cytidylyltransferase n=1 Tax=Daejeonella oryzae TaxID=1122943 RepID=UPI0003FA1374|nr:3-deoxy-manno-octulosonate cytidylyltransferase [Daejeonella oryzae]